MFFIFCLFFNWVSCIFHIFSSVFIGLPYCCIRFPNVFIVFHCPWFSFFFNWFSLFSFVVFHWFLPFVFGFFFCFAVFVCYLPYAGKNIFVPLPTWVLWLIIRFECFFCMAFALLHCWLYSSVLLQSQQSHRSYRSPRSQEPKNQKANEVKSHRSHRSRRSHRSHRSHRSQKPDKQENITKKIRKKTQLL